MFKLAGRLFSNSNANQKVNLLLRPVSGLPGLSNDPFKRGFQHTSEPNVVVSNFPSLPVPSETLGEYIWRDIEKWADKIALVSILYI